MTAIDRDRTAVLIMDYQNDVVQRFTQVDGSTLRRAAELLEAARKGGVPVVYVTISFRPGYPEVPEWGMFVVLRDSGLLQEGTNGARIHDAVAPQPGDVIVTKKRIGAATGSDLEQVLRSKRIAHLVLLGVSKRCGAFDGAMGRRCRLHHEHRVRLLRGSRPRGPQGDHRKGAGSDGPANHGGRVRRCPCVERTASESRGADLMRLRRPCSVFVSKRDPYRSASVAPIRPRRVV